LKQDLLIEEEEGASANILQGLEGLPLGEEKAQKEREEKEEESYVILETGSARRRKGRGRKKGKKGTSANILQGPRGAPS